MNVNPPGHRPSPPADPIATAGAIICLAFAVVFAAGGVMSQALICLAMAAWCVLSDLFPPTRNG